MHRPRTDRRGGCDHQSGEDERAGDEGDERATWRGIYGHTGFLSKGVRSTHQGRGAGSGFGAGPPVVPAGRVAGSGLAAPFAVPPGLRGGSALTTATSNAPM